MDSMTLMAALAARLGMEMGTGAFNLEENRHFRFRIDGRLPVTLEVTEDDSHIYLFEAFPVVLEMPPAAWGRLLEANLFGHETGGAAFSFDPLADEILLCQKIQVATTNEHEFLEMVERFVAALDFWSAKFSESEWWSDSEIRSLSAATSKGADGHEYEHEHGHAGQESELIFLSA